MEALDARGTPVAVGDRLLDGRGEVWEVLPTAPTVVASDHLYGRLVQFVRGVAVVVPQTPEKLVVPSACIDLADLVVTLSSDRRERLRTFNDLYETLARARNAAVVKERKRALHARLRPS